MRLKPLPNVNIGEVFGLLDLLRGAAEIRLVTSVRALASFRPDFLRPVKL